jgi:hypothetical protein
VKCQTRRHQECKGVRRLPNNLYAPCECDCHSPKIDPQSKDS